MIEKWTIFEILNMEDRILIYRKRQLQNVWEKIDKMSHPRKKNEN